MLTAHNKKNIEICVIGAGLGGLSAAARLASDGYRVTVFEKNSRAGGKAGTYESGGFRYDTGPSLITLPEVIKELFSYCGENISEYLTINKLDVLCRYFYEDGTIIDAYSDEEKFRQEIISKTSDDIESINRYLNYTGKIYELTSDLFLFGGGKGIKNFLNLKALSTLFQIFRIDPFRTMHSANRRRLKDGRTVQIFDRFATYNGSNPYRAPATLNLISNVEFRKGGYYLSGGMTELPKALEKLAVKKGAEIRYGSQIEEIIIRKGRAEAVRIGREILPFDVIITNADAHTTYRRLLPPEYRTENKYAEDKDLSTSALVFLWGIKGKHGKLQTHNIFFSGDYEKEFRQLSEGRVQDDPTVYVYISSRFSKNDAPKGFENWFVMINAPYDNGQDWDAEAGKAGKIITEKLSRILGYGISEFITSVKIITPKDIEENTGSYRGCIYGKSSDRKFSAFLRHPNKSHKIKNLYFCGGSTHPGGGIPLVILSGRNTAEIISRNIRD